MLEEMIHYILVKGDNIPCSQTIVHKSKEYSPTVRDTSMPSSDYSWRYSGVVE
jgi:hypothetical protein